MSTNIQILGLIIKSTRRCNLRCSYCHDWRSRGTPMSFEVLATLTAKALRPSEHRRVDFIWHGGEPLLLGREFYLKALCLQQEFRQDGQVIRNSLQTNGTLLDNAWCEFFKEHGFHIGVSIDGPEPLHNMNRVYASSRGSFAEVRRGISLLQDHEIPFGVLMVVNHEALKLNPERIFHFFLDDLGVKTVAFLPVRPDNVLGAGEVPTTDYITPSEYCAFMKRIFDLWYELDDPSIRIRELTSILSAIVGGTVSVCTLAGHCLGQYFHVEPSGDLYHCDKFLGDPDYRVGNILEDTFRNIRGSGHFQTLVSEEAKRLAVLERCPWFRICHGGCPHDRYIAMKYLPGFDGTCCGQRDLIEHMYQNVKDDLNRVAVLTTGAAVWPGVEA